MTKHVFLTSFVLLGAGASLAAGCAKDPAEDAPSAAIAEPTPAPAAEEPTEPEAPAEPLPSETLAFDQSNSKVGWVGSKVTRSHEGGFGEFAGTVTLEPSNLTASAVELTIQTASLTSDTEDLTKHLKSADFFDVDNIPTARFVSSEIAEGGQGEATHTITGDLTLHGVTKQVTFPATVSVSDEEVAANAEFSIDRQDFGISFPGMPDDLIRDGVVIKLDIHAPRSAEAPASARTDGEGEAPGTKQAG